MQARLTRNKVSPKSHKKVIAFIYAKKLASKDVEDLEYYLKERNDLHFIYLIVSKKPNKDIRTVCNRYNHIKLISSKEPEPIIIDIKKQFDGVNVKFEDRDFKELKNRSL